MRPRNVAIVAAMLATGLVSCAAPDHGSAASAAKCSDAVVTQFDPSPTRIEDSFSTLNQAGLGQPDCVRRVALRHLGDRTPRIHYAAVYALSLTSTASQGDAQLAQLLTSTSLDDRMLSAGSLASRGDKRGLPVLIDTLTVVTELNYWRPPTPASMFARAVLLNVTTEDMGLIAASDTAAVATTQAAWKLWWTEHQTTLYFDAATGRFAL